MNTTPSIHIVTSPTYLQHDTGEEHPELGERLQVIDKALRESCFAELLKTVPPRGATREELMTFHPEDWLFRFEEAALSGKTYIDHPDNQIGWDSYDVALLSAGAGLSGIDLVEEMPGQIVFTCGRPPGHHAEPATPYGFCFFNNAVIAARYWQNTYQRRRVCVLDFDAHHGNGIQTAFETDATAAYVSIHEHPSFSFPGTGWPEETGVGEGKGTILNIPLPPGAGERRVQACLARVEAFVADFQPDALIVSAGFDGHEQDHMSGLALTDTVFGQLGEFVTDLSLQYTEGRMISILEGGYELSVLGGSVVAYLQGILARSSSRSTIYTR